MSGSSFSGHSHAPTQHGQSPSPNADTRTVGNDPLRIGRLPIHFFVFAVISFAIGVCALPLVIGQVSDYFYQAYPLALVHTFTLGWITATIMGVMYRYVPALTHHPISYPRLALWQLWIFILGATGMIVHFALGVWFGMWSAAIVVVGTVVLFAINMTPCLYRELGRGVAETGMFLSICMLIVAGSVGAMLGMDKDYNFLGGDVISNLAGHVHLAAMGWVTLTICAVSYRMLPAFLLPEITLPRSAVWQLWTLCFSVLLLGAILLLGWPGASILAIVACLSLSAYIVTIGRLVRSRRMPIDSTSRHAIAGIFWLVLSMIGGIILSFTGAQSLAGSRIAAAYGVVGLLGFFSNFIIGMSYQLFPGFVTRSRMILGWPMASISELSIRGPRWLVFVAFNAGVAVMAVGLLIGSATAALVGSIMIEAAGLGYALPTLWTISWAYRRSVPAASRSPLRVLPS